MWDKDLHCSIFFGIIGSKIGLQMPYLLDFISYGQYNTRRSRRNRNSIYCLILLLLEKIVSGDRILVRFLVRIIFPFLQKGHSQGFIPVSLTMRSRVLSVLFDRFMLPAK